MVWGIGHPPPHPTPVGKNIHNYPVILLQAYLRILSFVTQFWRKLLSSQERSLTGETYFWSPFSLLDLKIHISDFSVCEQNMNYPRLHLNQNQKVNVFFWKQNRQNLGHQWGQKLHEIDECDQCEYKTTKFMAMYAHKREKHIGVKKKCAECDYSHVYLTKVRGHYNRVHMGVKK